MLIPKLNKFQAIPKKKYRVISEDPQTCVKPFPWKPGVRKTSLENWKTNTRWSSRIRCVSSEIIYANYGELGVSPLWVTPLSYRNVIIKRLIIIQECHSLQKKKKILSHLNKVAFTAIKQVSAIWCKLFISINEKPLLYVLKLSSPTLHIQSKPFCQQINKNSQ